MKTVAILQSNYIPWKGYFDMIAAVDEFIIYDDMQYTKNDWRNRNQIKTRHGLQWLTIPVGQDINRRIRDVQTPIDWQSNHWKTLVQNYRKAPCFNEVSAWLAPLYLERAAPGLSETNRLFMQTICDYLRIETKISNCWDYDLPCGKTERLVSLCRQAGADRYISGPAARDYIDRSLFDAAGIDLVYFDYAGFEPYPQLWGEFVHGVSILDMLFNCGSASRRYMRH